MLEGVVYPDVFPVKLVLPLPGHAVCELVSLHEVCNIRHTA